MNNWQFLMILLTAAYICLGAVGEIKAQFTCHGFAATIVGTSGNDLLIGTPGDDVIVGLGGNDNIKGWGGKDRICADRPKGSVPM